MSALTPLAVTAAALIGAAALALLDRALEGVRPAPLALGRRAVAVLRQPIAAPDVKDAFLYHTAPALLLLSALLGLAMVPWAPGFRGVDLSTGAILYSAALAYVPAAILMAGWGAGRPLSVIGGFRFVAQYLAYEMPVVMAVTAVAASAESLRPAEIVAVQHAVPAAVAQPLAFALFVPSVMAIAFIPPFDLPQASSELGGGAFSEYTGLHAALVWLAQRVLVLGAAAMTVALFLGGWQGPLLPPLAWSIVKTLAVAAGMIWAGRRLPRVQIDALLPFAWKVAIPLALLALAWGGVVTVAFYA